MSARTSVIAGTAAALLALALPVPAADAGGGGGVPSPLTSSALRSAPLRMTAGNGAAIRTPRSKLPCHLAPSAARAVLTDCYQPWFTHAETAIAVNPRDQDDLVGSANDEQLGTDFSVTLFSRAHVSFDRGRSWSNFRVPYAADCTYTGDPSVAFDARGLAYLASLCQHAGEPDVVVSHSTDGGRTWSAQSLVARGSRHPNGVDNDHPALTAWGRGNVVVTWYRYLLRHNTLATGPLAASVSHDGARSWSPTALISGSAPFCTGLSGSHACDQGWGNAVARADAKGRILATFFDTTAGVPGLPQGRSRHLAVELDPNTGQRIAGPFLIGQAYDGTLTRDYPVSESGFATLHDSQFRVESQGNITADPTDPSGRHFAVVWFDDRNAPHPVNPDPYAADTDTDVIVSQTYDAGRTWTDPIAIRESRDQFMAWAAYDSTGRLRIGYDDRSYDTSNQNYGYTLATEFRPGDLQFRLQELSTALSNPVRNGEWSSLTVNARFPYAAPYIGDYTAVAAGPDFVVAYWAGTRWNCDPPPDTTICGWNFNSYASVVR